MSATTRRSSARSWPCGRREGRGEVMARKPRKDAGRVGALIAESRAVVPDAAGNSHRRWHIIDDELCWLDDERILPFFIEVAGDTNDFDLARISVFKALVWKVSDWKPSPEQRVALGQVITRVMNDTDDDNLVRNYATQPAPYFADIPGAFPAAAAILLHPNAAR